MVNEMIVARLTQNLEIAPCAYNVLLAALTLSTAALEFNYAGFEIVVITKPLKAVSKRVRTVVRKPNSSKLRGTV